MKILVPIILLLLVGCADPARNLYEGVRLNKDSLRSPNERALSPSQGYDEYKKERDTR